MRRLLIASSAVLAGCGTTVRTVEVRVPVAVACIERMPDRPAFVADDELRVMSDYQLALALARDRLQRRQYIDELEAVARPCTQGD